MTMIVLDARLQYYHPSRIPILLIEDTMAVPESSRYISVFREFMTVLKVPSFVRVKIDAIHDHGSASISTKLVMRTFVFQLFFLSLQNSATRLFAESVAALGRNKHAALQSVMVIDQLANRLCAGMLGRRATECRDGYKLRGMIESRNRTTNAQC